MDEFLMGAAAAAETQGQATALSLTIYFGIPAIAIGVAAYLGQKSQLGFIEGQKEYLDEIADACSVLMFGLSLGVNWQLNAFKAKVSNDPVGFVMKAMTGGEGQPSIITFGTTLLWTLGFFASAVCLANFVMPNQSMNKWAISTWGFKEYFDESKWD